MSYSELKEIKGGVSYTTIISTIIRGISTIYDIGRRVGSYVVRAYNNKMCAL